MRTPLLILKSLLLLFAAGCRDGDLHQLPGTIAKRYASDTTDYIATYSQLPEKVRLHLFDQFNVWDEELVNIFREHRPHLLTPELLKKIDLGANHDLFKYAVEDYRGGGDVLFIQAGLVPDGYWLHFMRGGIAGDVREFWRFKESAVGYSMVERVVVFGDGSIRNINVIANESS